MRSLLINTANTAALPATKTNTKTASAEPVEVRISGSRAIDRRPSTGSGLTGFFVRGGLGMKRGSMQTSTSTASYTASNSTQTITKAISAEPVEVRLSDSRAIDRRPSTGSGLTGVFVSGGLGMKRGSMQTATSTASDIANNSTQTITQTNTKTVSAEPVEVRLSALRVIYRRPSTGSGLTGVFVRGGLGMKLRSIQTANMQTSTTKTVSAEPVEVRLSASRIIDRRISKGSALTDLVAVDRFTKNFMRGSRI